MADTPATFAWHAILTRSVTGANPRDGEELFTGGEPRYRCYATRDGRLVAVGAIEDKFWQKFCGAIGLPQDLRGWTADRAAAMAYIEAVIACEDAAHWRAVLEPLDAIGGGNRGRGDGRPAVHRARGLYARSATLPDGTVVPRAFVPIAAPSLSKGGRRLKRQPAVSRVL